ncbi:isoprenylcysteine carboxylmethyltransferase family protein [Candidatus Woesearchaeota archaeon]|nr:MAG: isoprenylcysteine carboxylmethyltransferase family protein [Candidatus Woesearchaeota archaeon]
MVNLVKILIAESILLLLIALAILGKNIKRLFILSNAKTARKESLYIYISSTAFVSFLAIASYLINKPEASPSMWTGAAIFLLAGLWQCTRRLRTKSSLEEALKNKTANKTYKRIRHPDKLAISLMLLGLCLATGSAYSLLIYVAIYIPSLIFLIHEEESALLDRYEDYWQNYASKTRRLIPNIY